jgi:heme/copper-type cytochrome/quinol oxidase subunit 2
MNSNTTRVVAGIVIVAVAVVLFVVLRDDGNSTSEKADTATSSADSTATDGKSDKTDAGTEITTIVIKNGKPVGGIADLTYNKGEQVRFKVDSDVSDEVHVHGYDIMKDVEAGGSVSFDFPATIEGIFEAELEGRGEQILELTVNP